jgi:hypothetical protein
MRSPPDARTPPGHPDGASALQEPRQLTAKILQRCDSGAGCVEVTARVEAAHVARYIDHDDAQADQLLATAQRWARAHQYGCGHLEDGAA